MNLYSPSAISMLTEDIFEYKEKANEIVELFRDSVAFRKTAINIKECGSCLEYGILKDGTFKLTNANFCRERACPQCQKRRSLRVYANTCRVLNFLGDDYSYLHLVLTIPNTQYSELAKTITNLFQKSSLFFKKPELKKAFKGIMRCFEVTYNRERNDYHPHLHCLIAVQKSYFTSRDYIRHEKLRNLWEETYQKAPLNLFIEKAYDGVNAIAEIAKYAVKPFELLESDEEKSELLEKIFSALHNRRLIQTYGVISKACRALKIELEESEENDTNELQNTIRLRWNGQGYEVIEQI